MDRYTCLYFLGSVRGYRNTVGLLIYWTGGYTSVYNAENKQTELFQPVYKWFSIIVRQDFLILCATPGNAPVLHCQRGHKGSGGKKAWHFII